jgi:hypothetical protein
VGEISLPSLKWGPQKATFDVTNDADFGRLISVEVVQDFQGVYLSPHRRTRSDYLIGPRETRTITEAVDIPGNYGKAKIEVGVYEIVDTLDPLLPYQRIAFQPFMLNYHIPDAVLPYFDEQITFPPRVDNCFDFDSEFARLLFLLFNEGKTPGQIAAMCQCDTSFVKHTMDVMARRGYMSTRDGKTVLLFPVITLDEVKAQRELAEQVAVKLADLVQNNLPAYREHMAEMAAAGEIPPNGDDFLDGGTALYYTYPTVSALFMWYDLGTQFIDPGNLMTIFRGSDYCNAHIPRYMYAVQGGSYYNGTNFFNITPTQGNMEIVYGDSVPTIECIEGYETIGRVVQDVHWWWSEEDSPEPFVLDTTIVKKTLKGLRAGVDELLAQTTADLETSAKSFGHPSLAIGHRFWFWNLATSRALALLCERGVMERYMGGHYRYEELSL